MMTQQKQHPTQSLFELAVTIVIPTWIMIKMSSADKLGAINSLIVALLFPFLYGLFKLIQEKKVNFIAVIGIISICLTGGIGVLKINTFWVPIKEAAIPLMIGVAVVVTKKSKFSLGRLLANGLLNQEIVDQKTSVPKIKQSYNRILENGTLIIASSFLLSTVLNFVLAKLIVTSPSGSEAFTQEIGKLTALSFPVISIPCMIVTVLAFMYMIKKITTLFDLKFDELIKKQ